MKKIAIVLSLITLLSIFSGCVMNPDNKVNYGKPKESQEKENKTKESLLTEDEAIALLYEKLGKEDPETGFAFSFAIINKLTIEDIPYYYGRWSWVVSDDSGPSHLCSLSEFFITLDGKELYTGTYDATSKNASLDKEKNLFDK